MIKKVLIANRGEIAVRIIRACKELGIQSVAVYSTADEHALHVELADEAVCIGGVKAKDSYLNMANLLSAACLTSCDAVHPGYGLLSENSKFARLVEQCGLIFIGPSPEIIDQMGNKNEARKMMMNANIPVIPGSKDKLKSLEDLKEVAMQIGYPVLIKAANGGGGRGMRQAFSPDELEQAYFQAKNEAKACFGADELYVEKLLKDPRHIEVQIMADHYGNVVHLYERDCSMQRRKQKMIEEAPSHSLSATVKEGILNDAIKICKLTNYNSVGTIEFLVDGDHYYFMEMNTRIQVEHTVSEMITNVDLIKQQIKIAAGLKLNLKQEDIPLLGHALECRINAEKIYEDFKPSPGEIKFLHLPGGKGVRIDGAVYSGYTIPPYYDSMILKIIVYAPSRLECIRKMRAALEELIIDGIDTNIEYHYMIMHNPGFVSGNYNITFMEKFAKELEESGKRISRKKRKIKKI